MEVVLLQLGGDVVGRDERLKRVNELLAREGENADLIVLPELWTYGAPDFSRCKERGEPVPGETSVWLSERARELSSYLVGGSLIERDGESYYNTSLLFDRHGELIGKYRKSHLLSYHSQERSVLSVGEDRPTFSTPLARLGIAVCYDLRFPEVFSAMAAAGAEVFVIPAAWPITRWEAWTALCHARAVENEAYVLACDGTGGGLLGRSMVVDPSGVTIASLGGEEGVLRTRIDLERLRGFREEFTAWREH